MVVTIILGVIIGVLSSGSGLGGGFLVVPFLLHLGKEVRVAVGTSIYLFLWLPYHLYSDMQKWGT